MNEIQTTLHLHSSVCKWLGTFENRHPLTVNPGLAMSSREQNWKHQRAISKLRARGHVPRNCSKTGSAIHAMTGSVMVKSTRSHSKAQTAKVMRQHQSSFFSEPLLLRATSSLLWRSSLLAQDSSRFFKELPSPL